MAIDPLILLPAAALAVLILILLIRLLAGRRDARLTPETLAEFLAHQEPGEKIMGADMSEDKRYALVRWENDKGVGLVRGFGDKLVLQMLGPDMLAKCAWRQEVLYIPRQGFAFPPVNFAAAEADRAALEDYLNGENDAAA